MNGENELNNQKRWLCKKEPPILAVPDNLIATYTVLNVLLKMRKTLGLEAMMDYIDKYLETIEGSNPEMKRAIALALTFVDVRDIYEEAMRKS